MDALYAFLTDGSTGLNAETLAAMRSDLSITTAELPDIAIVERWYHRASQATSFPYLSIVISSSSAEQEPNSRFYSTTFTMGLVVLDAGIAGDEVDVVTALWRYGDALKTLFQRRTPRGRQGWTLNNASGIIRASVAGQIPGSDPSITAPNVALMTEVTIVTSEEY